MITEDYCTEELVKLLLEKGCPLDKVIKQDGRPVYFTLPTNHPNWADCDVYYIPTHAQIMKWLRKEHGIHISADPYLNNEGEVTWVWEIINIETATIIADSFDDDFDSCEEAVETALKYIFENLNLINK